MLPGACKISKSSSSAIKSAREKHKSKLKTFRDRNKSLINLRDSKLTVSLNSKRCPYNGYYSSFTSRSISNTASKWCSWWLGEEGSCGVHRCQNLITGRILQAPMDERIIINQESRKITTRTLVNEITSYLWRLFLQQIHVSLTNLNRWKPNMSSHRAAFKWLHTMHISFAKNSKRNVFLAYLKTVGSHVFYGNRC